MNTSAIPYDRDFLQKCANDACRCGGHGYMIYRSEGAVRLCGTCIVRCEYCDAPLPVDDDHFDEGRPLTYDGMPACPVCREKYRREDAQTCDATFVVGGAV